VYVTLNSTQRRKNAKAQKELLKRELLMKYCKEISTPLGTMIAIGDDDALYALAFLGQKHFPKKVPPRGDTAPLLSIEKELNLYFANELSSFSTPITSIGTPFQTKVWKALLTIPPGQTLSYGALAYGIGHPKSFRAAAQAIGRNPLAIIVPCHRVINSSGALGGFAGGLDRKEWLLNHEKVVA
jgi:AraC family transcriptional regulator of adaptative response/methylated-DNA-[protein]-cysteine methyltransferase